MKRLIAIIGIVTISLQVGFSADNYEIGDTLFVWAKNGLNLRESTGTKSKILSKISFGEWLLVQEKSEETYNILAISPAESTYYGKNTDPVIFKGNWVKVIDSKGNVGYVIDQYLLRIRTFNITTEGIELETLTIDTIFKSALNLEIEKQHIYNIKSKIISGRSWASQEFEFQDFTIEEVLVLFSAKFDNYKNIRVQRNWKDQVYLTDDDEICDIRITKNKEFVKVAILCSC